MDDKIESHLARIEESVEELRSIANLLEHVAQSNERIARIMERSWDTYARMNPGQSQ